MSKLQPTLIKTIMAIALILSIVGCSGGNQTTGDGSSDITVDTSMTVNINHPASAVKLIFIHHSVGQNWLSSGNGNLGTALNNNNYFVSDTNYGWNAEPGDGLGNRTDTSNWSEWFTNTKMPYVYTHYSNSSYTNTITDPGTENEIIMFKSCYPNSEVGSSITDEQAIYNSLLPYFQTHMNKMFVLIVPPPQISISSSSLTRQLANWLANRSTGWLAGYTQKNVYVFDFYNVLTDPNNHHRIHNNRIEHEIVHSPTRTGHPNELYYFSGGDDHPTSTGSQKATAEFVPLLNTWYHNWKGI